MKNFNTHTHIPCVLYQSGTSANTCAQLKTAL